MLLAVLVLVVVVVGGEVCTVQTRQSRAPLAFMQ
jgi:hypothetical protein